MQPSQELVDDIYRERILRARQQPLEEKFVAGLELFANACEWMKDGIRHQFPDANEQRVQEILKSRINRLHQLDDALWTKLPASAD